MKIKHPTLSATYDLPDEQAKRWIAAGWLPVEKPEPVSVEKRRK